MSGRRQFGAVRQLPSGRWQARFRDRETNRYRTAEHTFATKTTASKWLSALETDMARGSWHDPKRGEALFADVAEQWYATKLHLRPSTLHLYRTLLDRHILPTFARFPLARSPRSTCRSGPPIAVGTRAWARTAPPRRTR
jgi:hypothetical protein